MAFTQANVDAMKAAIARGAKVLQLNGERVEYNTFNEMRAALRMMEEEVAGITPGSFKVTYPTTSRGL